MVIGEFAMKNRVADLMVKGIRLYQRMAPRWMRGLCRYTPSCSEYAVLVIRQRGPILGSVLAFSRVLRCIPPFGGVDWPGVPQEGAFVASVSQENDQEKNQ